MVRIVSLLTLLVGSWASAEYNGAQFTEFFEYTQPKTSIGSVSGAWQVDIMATAKKDVEAIRISNSQTGQECKLTENLGRAYSIEVNRGIVLLASDGLVRQIDVNTCQEVNTINGSGSVKMVNAKTLEFAGDKEKGVGAEQYEFDDASSSFQKK